MQQQNVQLAANHGGPLHYLGNRFLTLPDTSGHMHPDLSWLEEHFSVLKANQKEKYRRCIEPFSGSASWSLAAMELDLSEEYIINDSNHILINTLQLIRDNPQAIKESYSLLVEQYNQTASKKQFFIDIIQSYNNKIDEDSQALILPFIINHSWSGILFHDSQKRILYREGSLVNGTATPRYLEKANLTVELFNTEVDRVSLLFNTHRVHFSSGDFLGLIADIKPNDFIS